MATIETNINPRNCKQILDVIPDSIAQLSFLTDYPSTEIQVLILNQRKYEYQGKTTDANGKFTLQLIASGNTPADLPSSFFNQFAAYYFIKFLIAGETVPIGTNEGIRINFSNVTGMDPEFIIDLSTGVSTGSGIGTMAIGSTFIIA